MIRKVTILSLTLLLLSAKFAAADSFDDCVQDCSNAYTQCVEAITLYDETGVKEAKAVCANEMKECKGPKCHNEDAKSTDDADQAKRQKEAEEAEAEKKRQEQQETVNGEIKVYKFAD